MEQTASRLAGVTAQLLALALALALAHLAKRYGFAEDRYLNSNRSMWGRTRDHDDGPSYDRPSTAVVFVLSWFILWFTLYFLFDALGNAIFA